MVGGVGGVVQRCRLCITKTPDFFSVGRFGRFACQLWQRTIARRRYSCHKRPLLGLSIYFAWPLVALVRETVDIDHGLGKGLGGFLRQVVTYATRDQTVGVFAREFVAV